MEGACWEEEQSCGEAGGDSTRPREPLPAEAGHGVAGGDARSEVSRFYRHGGTKSTFPYMDWKLPLSF